LFFKFYRFVDLLTKYFFEMQNKYCNVITWYMILLHQYIKLRAE